MYVIAKFSGLMVNACIFTCHVKWMRNIADCENDMNYVCTH